MLNWLRKLLQTDTESLLERIEALEEDNEELAEDLEQFRRSVELDVADLYDQILPTLKRLQNRGAVRESREKAKDIYSSSDRKGGIIRDFSNGTPFSGQKGNGRG